MARIVPVCLQNVLCSSVRALVLIVREIGHRVFTVNEKIKLTWEVQEVEFIFFLQFFSFFFLSDWCRPVLISLSLSLWSEK